MVDPSSSHGLVSPPLQIMHFKPVKFLISHHIWKVVKASGCPHVQHISDKGSFKGINVSPGLEGWKLEWVRGE